MKRMTFFCSAAILMLSGYVTAAHAAVIPVVEDVMTSSFFTGTNRVRGYSGEQPTFRVSTDGAFDLTGAETVYLMFAASDFASYGDPVPSAVLSVESISGGFGADANASNPFQISAHAVNANPLTSITDDTNPGGPINWLDFYNNNILPAATAATTTVTGFGPIHFDVTAIVNDWISGANTEFAIALTGKNHTLDGNDYLHGIRNNNGGGTPLGSTFITVVPEPCSFALLCMAGVVLAGCRRARVLA